ncbi:MAG: hypothetical protein IKJ19_03650 [Clostridia bacterium]|nr:hypothetical protein [Clostridia bacterium]
MCKDNLVKKYEFPPISLLGKFVNDPVVTEEGYVDQDQICAFITSYFLNKQFSCNILGVDYGFNVTQYKIQLLSCLEKDDGYTYKNLFDKRKFYIEFIRKLHEFAPARISGIKIIDDRDAPSEFILSVRIPNAFVRSIPLSHHLQAKSNKFDCVFACDKYSNPTFFDCESGLTVIVGSDEQKIYQTLRTSLCGLSFKYSPSELKIILNDTGKNLSVFNGIANLQFGKNFTNPNAFYTLLKYIKDDYKRLNDMFLSSKCEDFDAYNQKSESKIARKLVIIGDYLTLQKNYDAFIRVCNDELKYLIKNSKKFGYSFLIFSALKKNYPLFDLENFITNKIIFRTDTEALSLLSINADDAHWLMPSNDAFDCYANERIIPCFTTDFEIHSVCDFLKQNNPITTTFEEYEGILVQSKTGFMSEEERKQNLQKARIVECVRLSIKEGYIMPSLLYNHFAIETEVGKNIISACEEMGYLKKSILPGSLQPNLSKEDFEKIFNEKF